MRATRPGRGVPSASMSGASGCGTEDYATRHHLAEERAPAAAPQGRAEQFSALVLRGRRGRPSRVRGPGTRPRAGPWTRRAASRIPSTDTRPKTNVKMLIRASPGARPSGSQAGFVIGRYPTWSAVPPRRCGVHSGTALEQSGIACRPVFWKYCPQVRQRLARLDDARGSQEAGPASGACSLAAAHQWEAGLL
jgi:hypothetical protein